MQVTSAVELSPVLLLGGIVISERDEIALERGKFEWLRNIKTPPTLSL